MEYIIVLCVLLVIVVAYFVHAGRSANINDLPIEAIPDEGIDNRTIKEEFFDVLYKVVAFEEEDGTTGVYVMDKKTHIPLAYTVGNGLVVIKQQEKK